MRHSNYKWCSAMTAALALALVPFPASARLAPPSEAPQPEPEPLAEPIPPIPPIDPAPPVAPTPMPPPAPMPVVPWEVQTAPVEGPAPAAPTRHDRMHKAGIGLMVSGGLVATTGFGVVLAFTIVGDQQQHRPEPVIADIEESNALAQIGGILVASGLAVVAVGGIVFARGHHEQTSKSQARVRVLPALGGVVLSGEF